MELRWKSVDVSEERTVFVFRVDKRAEQANHKQNKPSLGKIILVGVGTLGLLVRFVKIVPDYMVSYP